MTTSHRPRRPARLAALAALALSLALPPLARAQLGGLRKRAQAAASAAIRPGQDTASAAPTDGPEITPALLAQMIRGLEAAVPAYAERDRVAQQQQQGERRRNALYEQHQPAIDRYHAELERSDACRHTAFDRINDRRRQEFDAKSRAIMSNPAEMARMQSVSMKYARDMAMAHQRGDTVAMRKLAEQQQRDMLGADVVALMRADTAQVDRECGKGPAKPAALAEIDSITDAEPRLIERMRALEQEAAQKGAAASGLPAQQFAAARERIYTWYQRAQNGISARGFSGRELSAMQSRRADLQRVDGALKQ